MTTWQIEFQGCLQPIISENTIDMRACTALDQSESVSGSAWTDGTFWTDVDSPTGYVGWTDWPPVL